MCSADVGVNVVVGWCDGELIKRLMYWVGEVKLLLADVVVGWCSGMTLQCVGKCGLSFFFFFPFVLSFFFLFRFSTFSPTPTTTTTSANTTSLPLHSCTSSTSPHQSIITFTTISFNNNITTSPNNIIVIINNIIIIHIVNITTSPPKESPYHARLCRCCQWSMHPCSVCCTYDNTSLRKYEKMSWRGGVMLMGVVVWCGWWWWWCGDSGGVWCGLDVLIGLD